VAIIKKTLADFGIDVEMGETKVGPTVTQYTLRPDVGVKLSQIAALLGLEYQGNGAHALKRIANTAAADDECLVFLEKSVGLALSDSLQAKDVPSAISF